MKTYRPNRHSGDGDPLDICVLTEKAFAHDNFFLRAKPIGGLRKIDGHQAEDKIIAVLSCENLCWTLEPAGRAGQ